MPQSFVGKRIIQDLARGNIPAVCKRFSLPGIHILKTTYRRPTTVTFQTIRNFVEAKDWDSLTKTYGFNPCLDAVPADKIRGLMLECALFGPDGSNGFPRVLLNALDDVAQQIENKDTESRVVDALRNEQSRSRRAGKVGDVSAIGFQINKGLSIINPLRIALFAPDYEVDWSEVTIALDIVAEELYDGIKMV